ncbi:uncharacterized protein LOC62_07G009449 [Vanrija pseudolonga]|uniref:Uncharacterized protein n=1 Tax=Vanrija pseudolonga TaxID=143232 RepID=A0AAF0YFT9_9TREE|nr:hypothetical protein LOC62_07G009449 [Vanrija pseudolonga]
MARLMQQKHEVPWTSRRLKRFYRHRDLVSKAWARCDLLYDTTAICEAVPSLLNSTSRDDLPFVKYVKTLRTAESMHRAGIAAIRHRHNVTLGLKFAPYHLSRSAEDLRIFQVQLPALMRELHDKIYLLNMGFMAGKNEAGVALMVDLKECHMRHRTSTVHEKPEITAPFWRASQHARGGFQPSTDSGSS